MQDFPKVRADDPGIRPAGAPDACLYCRRKIGQSHGPECVMVVKTVEIRVKSKDGHVGTWITDVPHNWSEETINFCRNESSWCAGNVVGENITWDNGEDVAAQLARQLGEDCLCNVLSFEFVRDVDTTPRLSELSDSPPQ